MLLLSLITKIISLFILIFDVFLGIYFLLYCTARAGHHTHDVYVLFRRKIQESKLKRESLQNTGLLPVKQKKSLSLHRISASNHC
jgi:predicted membrane protein